MFTFDDAEEEIYTNIFPIMSSLGKPGTFYVWTSRVGLEDRVTEEQLLEMEAAGWSIANHTQNHPDLTTLSQAEAQAEIEAGKADLLAMGITGAVNHLAYPFGAHNATVVQAALDAGMVTQRKAVGSSVFELDYTFDPNAISLTKNILEGDTLEDLKAFVDSAVSQGKIALFLAHRIPGDLSVEDFQALVEYCVEQNCRFMTIEDLYSDYLSNEL